MNDFKILKEMIKRFQGKRAFLYFGEIIVLGISSSLISIMASRITGNISNAAIYGQSLANYNIIASIFLIILFIIINNIFGVLYNNEAKRTGNVISNSVYSKVFKLPMTFYNNNHSSEYMSKIIFDSQMAAGVFGSRLRRLIMPVLTVCICIIPMIVMCPPVTAGLVVISALSFALDMVMIPFMKKYSKKISDNNKEITKSVTNIISGMDIIRMFPISEKVLDDFNAANNKCAKNLLKQGKAEACVTGVKTAFDLIGSLAFLALGLMYMEKTNGSIGNLVSLYVLYGTFQYNFLQIGVYIPSLSGFLVNAERVLVFLNQPEYENVSLDLESDKKILNASSKNQDERIKKIEIKNLTFSYKEQSDKIFDDFSVEFKSGFNVLIGPSGRGKTTLVKLMMDFYPITSGKIIINDKKIYDGNFYDLKKHCAYVPQEPYMFNISIMENIRLGRPDATDEEVINAAKMAYAHDFIMEQEKGYDTILGERGNTVSGGQRQRLAIARAILKNADVIIMDEATSALDNQSEDYILKTIDKIKKNTMILMIAHRPSTIKKADRVVEI